MGTLKKGKYGIEVSNRVHSVNLSKAEAQKRAKRLRTQFPKRKVRIIKQ